MHCTLNHDLIDSVLFKGVRADYTILLALMAVLLYRVTLSKHLLILYFNLHVPQI